VTTTKTNFLGIPVAGDINKGDKRTPQKPLSELEPLIRAVIDDPTIKAIGFGLAVGVLIDAFVVRMTLVPAFLTLLGEKSWYIPRWLDRILPNITIEPPHDGGEPAPVVPEQRVDRPAPDLGV
jgi:hypothetical protein